MTRTPIPPLPAPKQRDRSFKQPLVGGEREVTAVVECVRIGRCCRLIGPRYHQKSQMMRRACQHVKEQLGYVCLYLSMWDVRATSEAAFFASIRDAMAAQVSQDYSQRLPRSAVKTAADLTSFFTSLPDVLRANVVLFADDLEAAPPDYLAELLRVLRAAYQNTATGLRFLSVVCASHSLARTALGPTSPFENISNLVMVSGLKPGETREFTRRLLSAHCPSPTRGALDLIHDQTRGDRLLVSEVCRECCTQVTRRKASRLTRNEVRLAMDSLVRRSGRGVIADGLQQIENDVDVLRAILLIMRLGEVSAAEAFFEPNMVPDPLTTSGFVQLEQGHFRIKSDLHYRLLAHHFTPERVGRILFADGDWGRAIYYLGSDIRQGSGDTTEDRSAVMRAAVSAMYAVQNKREAYQYLGRGFETAYPHIGLRLYDLDAHHNQLVCVHHSATGVPKRWPRRVSLSRTQLPEARAVANPQEYMLRAASRQRLTLYVPLRTAAEEPLGLAAIDNYVTSENFRRRHDQILELVGYARQAARALKNRVEFEQLHQTTTQRAEDLGHLLELTHELMAGQGNYQEVLNQALHMALKALSRYAQMGSIYLYDRQTGKVVMRADTGYPEEIRVAARFAPREGLAGYVYHTGRAWNVHDTASDKRYAPLPAADGFRVYSSLGVPLLGRRGPIGVLCLDNLKRTHAFDAESEQLLKLFAGQVALWLENARLLEILRDLNGAAVALQDLASVSPQVLLERLAERLSQNFEVNGCAIGQRVGDDRLDFVVRHNLPHLREHARLPDVPAALIQTVLREGRHLHVPNIQTDDTDWEHFLGSRAFTSLVALPLPGDEQHAGVILLTSIGEFEPSEEEVDLMTTFAIQVTIAQENASLYGKVHGELRQRIEELQEANRQLDIARRREVQFRNARLATGLLHQINNAVANIPELVDELRELTWPEKAGEPLEELRLNALAANHISKWLHEFVKIGNLTLEPVDLPSLVRDVQQRLENRRPPYVHLHGPEVTGDVPPVRADRALIDVLIENLLRNAYEAIPESQPGEVAVYIAAENSHVTLRIKDNGVGIAPELRRRIWEWGWTTKDVNPDSHDRGLGLFASHQIVEAHDGTIELEEPAKPVGSAFLVRLPVGGPQIAPKA